MEKNKCYVLCATSYEKSWERWSPNRHLFISILLFKYLTHKKIKTRVIFSNNYKFFVLKAISLSGQTPSGKPERCPSDIIIPAAK